MAESNDNWIGSWFNAAKEKIKHSEVLESVRKDLEEFGGAVSKGASSVLTSTGSVIEKTLSLDSPDSTANTVKKSFSTFLDQVNTVLNPSPDDSDTEAMVIEGSEVVSLTKLQQLIYNLQNDEETFIQEPDAHFEKQYECWLEILDDQISEERTEKYLKNSELLRKQYEKLVPTKISREMFWKRYLFKKALLEDEIARQEIQERKEILENQKVEESVEWEKETFTDEVELTEEQQIKLLEEYEKETRGKRKSSKNENRNDLNVSPSHSLSKQDINNSDRNTINKIDSAVSLDTTSSNSSVDDEWVKVTAVEK